MISVRQLKAACALLGWSQDDLAARCGVSRPTLARLETADDALGGYASTQAKIVQAFEAAGIEFTSDTNGSVGVQLKAQGH